MRLKLVGPFLLAVWLGWAVPALAAVVPDGDALPREPGAPSLPGGHSDTTRHPKPGGSASPSVPLPPVPTGLASPSAHKTAAPGPSGSATGGSGTGSRSINPGGGGQGSTPFANENGATNGALDVPPTTLYFFGAILLLFVGWAGLKARRGDQED